MEIHPPEHPIFTWKQFFIHMATVCLGLLIALALEQTVEGLHHHEQAGELREALDGETSQLLHDQTGAIEYYKAIDAWSVVRRQQLYDGLWNNKPVPPTPLLPKVPEANPDPADPIFSAALANGRVALLTPEEVSVYQDIHSQIAESKAMDREIRNSDSTWLSFERSLPQRVENSSGTSSVDYTRVSAEDRRKDLELFLCWQRDVLLFTHSLEQLVAAEREIATGERNLDRIHAAEDNTWESWKKENELRAAHH
jgi:hypothetical protein